MVKQCSPFVLSGVVDSSFKWCRRGTGSSPQAHQTAGLWSCLLSSAAPASAVPSCIVISVSLLLSSLSYGFLLTSKRCSSNLAEFQDMRQACTNLSIWKRRNEGEPSQMGSCY